MLSSLSSYRRFVVQHWHLAQLACCVRRPHIVGSTKEASRFTRGLRIQYVKRSRYVNI